MIRYWKLLKIKKAEMISKLERAGKRLNSRIAWAVFPNRWKKFNELRCWRKTKKTEGVLSNDHYEHFYTTHFGLDGTYYENKVILDIGCGPRGSLEWASMASRVIGVDPLAKEYLRLGANRHRMEYIDAPSEKIPVKDAECDAVFSFNSLDHVDDVDQTLREIKRITRLGGIFLLLVEVNHSPTNCEPHQLTPRRLLDSLKPGFDCERLDVYKPVMNGMYRSILANERFCDPENTGKIGYLSAKFVRTPSI
jgi:ubiquinone/menaquinone biosynthesis C-methylase UbiE